MKGTKLKNGAPTYENTLTKSIWKPPICKKAM